MKVKIWWQHRHQPFESRWIIESLTGDRLLASGYEFEVKEFIYTHTLDVVDGPENFKNFLTRNKV